MTTTLTQFDQYAADYTALSGEGQPQHVRDLRAAAWRRFLNAGLPTARRGNEKWKYTNVGPIASASFRHGGGALNAAAATERARDQLQGTAFLTEGWTNLVFVDGRFSETLSSPLPPANGVRAMSLGEAIAGNEPDVERRLAEYASPEDDGFVALNTAFLRDGAYVRIGEGAKIDTPLNLVFCSTASGEPTATHPRALVVAEAGSAATIVESYVGPRDQRYFTNSVTEIALERGARIDHHRLLLESEQAYHVGVARVRQAEDSVYSSKSFEKGPAIGRYDLAVTLDGPGSYCDLGGLYITSGRQHMDNFINIDHVKPYGTSRLYYKGILSGRSRAVFGGTVWVREGAMKTDSLQSDKNLVLSPQAEVDSKPALYIYADDVKCGHGATAGNISEDTVFYMRSRGVDLETASRLLIYGFASEIIDMVKLDGLRDFLEGIFLDSLPSYRFEF